MRAPALTLATVLAVGGGLVGCTAGPPQPGPVAEALAEGIAGGDLSAVPLTGATAQEATETLSLALAGLEPLRPAVQVQDVTVDETGAVATAALAYTWDVDDGERDWTYGTTARMDLVEDAWVVRWSTFVLAPDLLEGEVLTVRRESAERAPVLGAGGMVLVEERPVLRLGLDKTRIETAVWDDAARQVAAVLGLEPEPYAQRVASAGERAFVEGLVVREHDPGVDLVAFAAVPGALEVADSLPLAPTRRFARPILGTAGPATAEIVEASGGQVQPGDVAGLSGLQRQYDEQLRGRPGLTILATSEATGAERGLFHQEPVAGEALVTTLDPELQDAAETILEPVGPASAVVAVRASTGEVLAAASGPGGEGYSTATLGTYAPGSVFKVVSSLALLRAGIAPDDVVPCPTTIEVDGRSFANFPGYPVEANGSITLRTALAHSCNTAFIGSRDRATQEALADAAGSLGLGGEGDLGLPVFLGDVPVEASGTDHAASMIGQGRVQVSPLAMAGVAASAAAGRTVVPWVVGEGAPQPDPSTTPLAVDEAAALRDMMRAVVTEGGATFLVDTPGPEVLAKTGTAQFGSGPELRNHAWMIAVQGDLAIAVFVEEGDYGSTTAGPLLEQLLAVAGPWT
ncbi:penicillin-binding transpeptidase domain-containing protein [Actinotalea sp. K2]|uniref:penicillin-binding transpeptidase domain-containing protein n=1 Tax=Actinotalea sp. K2 TaxID=2939438 RepID=UPI002017E575|nr:penicillin-binding transpeptidase domain-containing protein [Actinotalea sp. K2]MCL3862248.1 penicillin-binding transpeptidase domain-containing protein [Actinotalea sp. K2]